MRRYEKQANKKKRKHFSSHVYNKDGQESTPAHLYRQPTESAKELGDTLIDTAEAHEGKSQEACGDEGD